MMRQVGSPRRSASLESWGGGAARQLGQVVRLDRGYPLVRLSTGEQVRCEHATELVKLGDVRAVVGDEVAIVVPEGHDKGIIERILPRRSELVRKDPTERAVAQVLASNFDIVMVAQPLAEVNVRRLERELVLAFETGASVIVVLTKADLADDEEAVRSVEREVRDRVGTQVRTFVVSSADDASVEPVRALLADGSMAVLIGRSGVGKSSLVNMLVGDEVQETGEVRERDGKGRHTTVAREIVDIPGGGRVVDMPGVRGVGMWEADAGMEAAFADVEELASACRFRDCMHGDEPGCAVRAAVEEGTLAPARLESYLSLKEEIRSARERAEQAERKAKSAQSRGSRRSSAKRRGPRRG